MFSSWYEFFPRSTAKEPNQHGTFKDVLEIIPLVAEQGFDVIYFPPVHPIGTAHRKGKNNTTTALPDDVGVPWAIGNKEGGHKDILPELGSLEDFQEVIKVAAEHGIEIAMDFALQCSPDHPYVKGTSKLVQMATGWNGSVCRESTKEVSGYIPYLLRVGRLGEYVGRIHQHSAVLEQTWY